MVKVDGRRPRSDGFHDTLVGRPHGGLRESTRYKLAHFLGSSTVLGWRCRHGVLSWSDNRAHGGRRRSGRWPEDCRSIWLQWNTRRGEVWRADSRVQKEPTEPSVRADVRLSSPSGPLLQWMDRGRGRRRLTGQAAQRLGIQLAREREL